jgi:hypothetical protein
MVLIMLETEMDKTTYGFGPRWQVGLTTTPVINDLPETGGGHQLDSLIQFIVHVTRSASGTTQALLHIFASLHMTFWLSRGTGRIARRFNPAVNPLITTTPYGSGGSRPAEMPG